ncbi:hypothetical protein EV421DRAFT_348380 [Armillaria borealis]|uniref:Uncharacterized protein n=1 Tax=Armillaria borealis TaxID=47425 RepID=A0AA39JRH2_9AGAR|nr:hypothetical protein EV421DRAFT_348380 [Armillaria borealis]
MDPSTTPVTHGSVRPHQCGYVGFLPSSGPTAYLSFPFVTFNVLVSPSVLSRRKTRRIQFHLASSYWDIPVISLANSQYTPLWVLSTTGAGKCSRDPRSDIQCGLHHLLLRAFLLSGSGIMIRCLQCTLRRVSTLRATQSEYVTRFFPLKCSNDAVDGIPRQIGRPAAAQTRRRPEAYKNTRILSSKTSGSP